MMVLAVKSDDLNLTPITYTMEEGPSPERCPPILTMAHTHAYNLKRYTKLDIKTRKCISFDNFPREDSEL